MPAPSRIALLLLALSFSLGSAVAATAADYAGAISAYRRAHGLPAVKLDGRLNAVALKQARAMAESWLKRDPSLELPDSAGARAALLRMLDFGFSLGDIG